MRVLLRLILALMVAYMGFYGCIQQQSPSFGSQGICLSIRFDESFTPEQVSTMESALPELNRLSVNYRVVHRNERVTVNNWRSHDNDDTIAEYKADGRNVYIDVSRITTDNQLQAATLHEIGHLLHMNHVCVFPGERPNCSNVGFGDAVLNPVLDPTHGAAFTELDVREFRNVSLN